MKGMVEVENKSLEKLLEYLYVTGQLDNQDDTTYQEDNSDIAIRILEKEEDE